jgi:quercetin dioxygenase-like cupin family protein
VKGTSGAIVAAGSLHLPAMDVPTPFQPIAVDLRDYVEFDLEGARGRRVFATDVVAVDLTCLEPDQRIEARTFPTADVIYTVLGGIAWVVTDDAEVTLQALQSVMVPAGIPHGLRNDSPDPLIVQVVVSPPDEAPPTELGPAVTPDPELGRDPNRRSFTDRLRKGLGG